MITYVHCLSSAPVVSCWHRACYEDRPGERQTPFSFQPANKMGNRLQSEASPSTRTPSNEGCLRKRLLSVSKIHQKSDSLWAPKSLLGPLVKSPSGKTQTFHDEKGTVPRGKVVEFGYCAFLSSRVLMLAPGDIF